MEKKQYELCIEILRRFNQQGLLDNIILIGSWCVVFYKDYFQPHTDLDQASLKTRDMDFLVPAPSKISRKVDVPKLVKDLGFVTTLGGSKGYIKLSHPDLILEFLVPERGRGTDKPFPIPRLGLNASTIRYLTFISDNTIKVKVTDFHIRVPHPANFSLHKLIVSQKRVTKDKADKDRRMAIDILNQLIKKGDGTIIKSVFESVPNKWQKLIFNRLDPVSHRNILAALQ